METQTQVPQVPSTPPVPQAPSHSPAPQTKNSLVLIMSILLIITVAIAGLFYFQIQKLSKELIENKNPAATSEAVLTPSPQPTIKSGWEKYTNTKYGFEFIYPQEYKVLTDSNSLYGWPKAILLLYKGGQSYDMAVEMWESEAEYKQKYASQLDNIAAFENEGLFITLLNTNKDPDVAEIISSFKFIEATASASPTTN